MAPALRASSVPLRSVDVVAALQDRNLEEFPHYAWDIVDAYVLSKLRKGRTPTIIGSHLEKVERTLVRKCAPVDCYMSADRPDEMPWRAVFEQVRAQRRLPPSRIWAKYPQSTERGQPSMSTGSMSMLQNSLTVVTSAFSASNCLSRPPVSSTPSPPQLDSLPSPPSSAITTPVPPATSHQGDQTGLGRRGSKKYSRKRAIRAMIKRTSDWAVDDAAPSPFQSQTGSRRRRHLSWVVVSPDEVHEPESPGWCVVRPNRGVEFDPVTSWVVIEGNEEGVARNVPRSIAPSAERPHEPWVVVRDEDTDRAWVVVRQEEGQVHETFVQPSLVVDRRPPVYTQEDVSAGPASVSVTVPNVAAPDADATTQLPVRRQSLKWRRTETLTDCGPQALKESTGESRDTQIPQQAQIPQQQSQSPTTRSSDTLGQHVTVTFDSRQDQARSPFQAIFSRLHRSSSSIATRSTCSSRLTHSRCSSTSGMSFQTVMSGAWSSDSSHGSQASHATSGGASTTTTMTATTVTTAVPASITATVGTTTTTTTTTTTLASATTASTTAATPAPVGIPTESSPLLIHDPSPDYTPPGPRLLPPTPPPLHPPKQPPAYSRNDVNPIIKYTTIDTAAMLRRRLLAGMGDGSGSGSGNGSGNGSGSDSETEAEPEVFAGSDKSSSWVGGLYRDSNPSPSWSTRGNLGYGT